MEAKSRSHRPGRVTLSVAASLSALAAVAFAFAGQATTTPAEANGRPWGNAYCGQAIIGSGPSDWRQRSISADPLYLPRRPLAQMSRGYPPGVVTKMMVLVRGHKPVTLIVPGRLKKRVFLLHGLVPDRNGRPGSSFGDTMGMHEITFHPCAMKPRTVWPGGIRVVGRRAVKLRVRVGRRGPLQDLWLGRPRLYRRR